MPEELKKNLHPALYWIDSINGLAEWTGSEFLDYETGERVELTEDDTSTLGSCLGL